MCRKTTHLPTETFQCHCFCAPFKLQTLTRIPRKYILIWISYSLRYRAGKQHTSHVSIMTDQPLRRFRCSTLDRYLPIKKTSDNSACAAATPELCQESRIPLVRRNITCIEHHKDQRHTIDQSGSQFETFEE